MPVIVVGWKSQMNGYSPGSSGAVNSKSTLSSAPAVSLVKRADAGSAGVVFGLVEGDVVIDRVLVLESSADRPAGLAGDLLGLECSVDRDYDVVSPSTFRSLSLNGCPSTLFGGRGLGIVGVERKEADNEQRNQQVENGQRSRARAIALRRGCGGDAGLDHLIDETATFVHGLLSVQLRGTCHSILGPHPVAGGGPVADAGGSDGLRCRCHCRRSTCRLFGGRGGRLFGGRGGRRLLGGSLGFGLRCGGFRRRFCSGLLFGGWLLGGRLLSYRLLRGLLCSRLFLFLAASRFTAFVLWLRSRPPLRLLGMWRSMLGPRACGLGAPLSDRGGAALLLLFGQHFLINLFWIHGLLVLLGGRGVFSRAQIYMVEGWASGGAALRLAEGRLGTPPCGRAGLCDPRSRCPSH